MTIVAAALPPPPIPAEVDLTDFAFMPLEVRRLRDSKLASSTNGEQFRCAVLLWCAAWHQQPAGSLPDDEIELTQLAGYGRALQQWKKVRAAALYGWEKCSDGRLYHSVVVEKAREAWASKLNQRYRRECDRLRKENKRRLENKEDSLPIPSFEQWDASRSSATIPLDVQKVSGGKPADVPRNSPAAPQDSELKGREGKGREGILRQEQIPVGADPPDPPTLDAALFSEARKIFGKSIGGQINTAIREKGKPWIVGIIETCRGKDPEAARAYLVGAMRTKQREFQP